MSQTLKTRKFFALAVKQAKNLKRIKNETVKHQQKTAILKTLLLGLRGGNVAH